MHLLAAAMTAVHFTISRPAVFQFVAGGILGVPEHVIDPARRAFTILMVFAALVGYRRLWQGSLIQLGQTGAVAKTMIVRLVVTLAGLVLGVVLVRSGRVDVPGYIVGAVSLMAGIAAGAAAAWWYYRQKRGFGNGRLSAPVAERRDDQVRSVRALLKFYVPLSMTSVMELASRPILAFGIARSVMAMDSLATWPVVNSLLFLFTSIALSYQEAVVAKAGSSGDNIPVLRKFGFLLMATLFGIFLLLVLTGGSRLWFRGVAGIPDHLVELAQPAMFILMVMPIAVTGRSLLSGILVARQKTGFLSIAVTANTLVLLSLVTLLPRYTDLVGTVVAAIAFTSAHVVQVSVLLIGSVVSQRNQRRVRL
jgi:hypothetical protein